MVVLRSSGTRSNNASNASNIITITTTRMRVTPALLLSNIKLTLLLSNIKLRHVSIKQTVLGKE